MGSGVRNDTLPDLRNYLHDSGLLYRLPLWRLVAFYADALELESNGKMP